MRISVLLFIVVAVWGASAAASDVAKEKRWADQIVEELIDGEALWLEADNHKFLSILTPAQGQVKGGVILMHGIGVHPNWQQVIYPLRVRLAEQGWTTLSLQMPILHNEATDKDYVPLLPEVPGRIKAGITALKAQSTAPIYLVGHSMGAAMARYFMSRGGDPGVKGLIVIGTSIRPDVPELHAAASLEKVAVPVLDIYGENDLEAVLDSAGARRAAAQRGGNIDFRQVKVADADHFFEGFEDPLVQQVADWLENHRGL